MCGLLVIVSLSWRIIQRSVHYRTLLCLLLALVVLSYQIVTGDKNTFGGGGVLGRVQNNQNVES